MPLLNRNLSKRQQWLEMIGVLGSINLDFVSTSARLPFPGETIEGSSFKTYAGGKGANQALAARRAGSEVILAASVGKDVWSSTAIENLKTAGVDLSLVQSSNRSTGTATIVVADDGMNLIVAVPGANAEVNEQAAVRLLERMDADDTLLTQLETPFAAVEAALARARSRKIRSALNISPLTSHVVKLVKSADIVIMNESELAGLSGTRRPSEAGEQAYLNRLRSGRDQLFVVTKGAHGANLYTSSERHTAPALNVKSVDTTGAGDTFAGYLVAGLDQGLSHQDSLNNAVAAASLACTISGAQDGIPRIDRVRSCANVWPARAVSSR